MPIKPENRSKYPSDWKRLSDYIRFKRAKSQCECKGECGLHHEHRCTEHHGKSAQFARGKVILTVAHLCHDEACKNRKHLKAMCQRCHLRYDVPHHRQTIQNERHKKRAIKDLFA